MMRNARSMRGFTFIELSFVIAMSITIWLVALVVFQSSNGLVQDARVRTRAEAQHRRDLQALTNFLREVDIAASAIAHTLGANRRALQVLK